MDLNSILIHDDFFKVEKHIRADLIITQPPYPVTSYKGKVSGDLERFASKYDLGPNDTVELDLDLLSDKLYQSIGEGGTLILFYDKWTIFNLRESLKKAGFGYFRLLVNQIKGSPPLNSKKNYLQGGTELAILCSKGTKKTFNNNYHFGVFESNFVRNRFHYYEKSVSLLNQLILDNSNEGDLVFDPFMGSGSTGESAISLNRNFVGIEIDDKYYEYAKDRLGYLNKALF